MDINTKVNPNLHPDKIRGDSPGAKSARHALGALYVHPGLWALFGLLTVAFVIGLARAWNSGQ